MSVTGARRLMRARGRSERRERSELLLDVVDRAVHELRAGPIPAPQQAEQPDTRAEIQEYVGARIPGADAGTHEVLAQLHDVRARHAGVDARVGDDALRPAGRAADLVGDVADDLTTLGHNRERSRNLQRAVVRAAGLGDATERELHAGRIRRARGVAEATAPALGAGRVLALAPDVDGIRDLGSDEAVGLTGQGLPVLRPLDSALRGRAVGCRDERVLAVTDRVEPDRAEEAREVDLQPSDDRSNLVLQRCHGVDWIRVAYGQRLGGDAEPGGQGVDVGVRCAALHTNEHAIGGFVEIDEDHAALREGFVRDLLEPLVQITISEATREDADSRRAASASKAAE